MTTDYDKAIKSGGPPESIKTHFYNKYFKSHLKNPPSSENFQYLLDKAWYANMIEISNHDIQKMLFLGWICDELRKLNESEFVQTISALMQDTYDIDVILETSERDLFNSEGSSNLERIYSNMNTLYKDLFETKFRLWATIPYLYAIRFYGEKNRGGKPDSYVSIGAGVKFDTLLNIKISTIKGNLSDLIDGLDKEIRNAGGAHNTWEVTDDGKILFKIIDPRKGIPKGSGRIELTRKEYNQLLIRSRKINWVLELGVIIYLINNPDLAKKMKRIKGYKTKEIKRELNVSAEKKDLSIERLVRRKAENEIDLVIKHSPKVYGDGGEVFIGTEARYEIVTVKDELSFKIQAIYIMQVLIRDYYEKENVPTINLNIYNQKDICIAELAFAPSELKKLFLAPNEENIPIPEKGEWPAEKYIIKRDFPVPFGKGNEFKKLFNSIIKEWEKDHPRIR